MDPQGRLVGGRYRLSHPLGSGGMGTVWHAEDVLLDRDVAVKEVAPHSGATAVQAAVLRERTFREARAAARLHHPNAVTVYDVVEEDGRPWLVMELVDAPTLAQVIARDGPLTPARTAQVGLDVLGALQAAHARGIIHRDVKPGNVLLADDGRVVLTDFGIATSAGDPSLTSTGLLLGSPAYIAPERARGLPPEPASDLWSLGATLFTAVEGRPPYDAGNALMTVTAVVTGEHAPFVAAGPLEPVLDGLLEKDPAKRLSATSARARLLEVTTGEDRAPTVALARPEPAAEGRAGQTAALHLGEVREEIAGVDGRETGGRDLARPVAPAAAVLPVPPVLDPPTGRTARLLPRARGDRPTAAGAAPLADRPAAVGPSRVTAPPAVRPPLPRPARLERPERGGRSRPRLLAALVAVLLLSAAAGYALTRTFRDDAAAARALATSAPATPSAPGAADPTGAAAPTDVPTTSPRPTPSPPPTPSPTPTSGPTAPTPTSSPPAARPTPTASTSATAAVGPVPAGWSPYSDPTEGWTVAVPPGYVRSDHRGQVQFRNAEQGRTLRIDYTADPGPSAVAAWEGQSPVLARRLADYRELRLERVDFKGLDAADLEFTYTSGGTRLHVLDRNFISGDTAQALYWQVRADDIAASRPVFEQLAASFAPPTQG